MGHRFLDLYGPKWDTNVEGPLGDHTAESWSELSYPAVLSFTDVTYLKATRRAARLHFPAPKNTLRNTSHANTNGDI